MDAHSAVAAAPTLASENIVKGGMGRRKVKEEEEQKPSECYWFIDTWMFKLIFVSCSY